MKIAFLENNLQELSDVVAIQQKEMMELKKNNTLLAEKVRALFGGEEISADFEKPPHY